MRAPAHGADFHAGDFRGAEFRCALAGLRRALLDISLTTRPEERRPLPPIPQWARLQSRLPSRVRTRLPEWFPQDPCWARHTSTPGILCCHGGGDGGHGDDRRHPDPVADAGWCSRRFGAWGRGLELRLLRLRLRGPLLLPPRESAEGPAAGARSGFAPRRSGFGLPMTAGAANAYCGPDRPDPVRHAHDRRAPDGQGVHHYLCCRDLCSRCPLCRASPCRCLRVLPGSPTRRETCRAPIPDPRTQTACQEARGSRGLCGCCLLVNIHSRAGNKPRLSCRLQSALRGSHADWRRSPVPCSYHPPCQGDQCQRGERVVSECSGSSGTSVSIRRKIQLHASQSPLNERHQDPANAGPMGRTRLPFTAAELEQPP